MLAMEVSRFGGPEVLRPTGASRGIPGSGEVSVLVEAAGINFADLLSRMGLYPDAGDPPFIPGFEFAGTIEAVGEGVEGVRPGDDVIGGRPFGCYSERLVTAADLVLRRPGTITAIQGAAIPLTYLTAWHSLVYIGGLRRGERILIHNAGGAVGTAAVQVALHRGAVVLGTASSGKHDFLRSIGVEQPVDYNDEEWPLRVREASGGEGVEMVFDPLGGPTLSHGYELLAHTGRLVTFGVSSWAPGARLSRLRVLWRYLRMPRFSVTRMMLKNRGVFGVHIGHLYHRSELLRGELTEILELVSRGVLTPVVDRTFPLEKAADAHAYIHDRRNRGKVVLTVDRT